MVIIPIFRGGDIGPKETKLMPITKGVKFVGSLLYPMLPPLAKAKLYVPLGNFIKIFGIY